MITPQFNISQDEEHIHIKIQVSAMRFNAPGLELVVDGNLLVFYLSPYYLRLRFSHELSEDEMLNKVSYDSKEECITCKIVKREKGQIFEDLDLPTKLLATKHEKTSKGPLIQEVDSKEVESVETISKEGDLLDWEVKQELPPEEIFSEKYGFDNQYSGYISVSVANGNDINELDDPEHTDKESRVKERIYKENLKFDPEYYAAEYFTSRYGSGEELEINGIANLLKYVPPLISYITDCQSQNANDKRLHPVPVEFTEKEQQQMKENIPLKGYLIKDTKMAYISLLSLLYSYFFEQVEDEGVHTSESPWTIGKLTPQLSALDQQILLSESTEHFSIIKAVIITAIRRSLSFPLHRNYDLCIKVWKHTLHLLNSGKKMVIKALLDIHEIFRYHDVYYIYNKILLDDLCSWFISQGNETIITSLAAQAEKELTEVTKSEISFECVSEIDEATGELQVETLTIAEIEYLVDQEKIN